MLKELNFHFNAYQERYYDIFGFCRKSVMHDVENSGKSRPVPKESRSTCLFQHNLCGIENVKFIFHGSNYFVSTLVLMRLLYQDIFLVIFITMNSFIVGI